MFRAERCRVEKELVMHRGFISVPTEVSESYTNTHTRARIFTRAHTKNIYKISYSDTYIAMLAGATEFVDCTNIITVQSIGSSE